MKALILIGLQVDFFPLGAAEIADSELILPEVNKWLPAFDHVIAANFAYPPTHKMFVANYPWRKAGQEIDLMGEKILLKNYYCMEGSFGAELTNGFDHKKITHTVFMGKKQTLHPYSAFFDEKKERETGLLSYLSEHKITEIQLLGISLDNLFSNTIEDGKALGFSVKTLFEKKEGA